MKKDFNLVQEMPTSSIAEDLTVAGITTILGSLPFIGTALASAVKTPFEILARKDLEDWLRILATAVDFLVDRTGLSYDDIMADSNFRAAVRKASQSAAETADTNILTILANATCHSGAWSSVEPQFQVRFMRILERFDPEHLLCLRAMHDPVWALQCLEISDNSLPLHTLFDEYIFPGLNDSQSLGNQVLNELRNEDFLAADYGLGAELTYDENNRMSSHIGGKFLTYCAGIKIDGFSHFNEKTAPSR